MTSDTVIAVAPRSGSISTRAFRHRANRRRRRLRTRTPPPPPSRRATRTRPNWPKTPAIATSTGAKCSRASTRRAASARIATRAAMATATLAAAITHLYARLLDYEYMYYDLWRICDCTSTPFEMRVTFTVELEIFFFASNASSCTPYILIHIPP